MRPLEDLAADLSWAKECEDVAKEQRIKVEAEICKRIPAEDGKKQVTVKLEGGGSVTVKRDTNYSADTGAILKLGLWSEEELAPPIKTKAALDVTGYHWYEENRPRIFARLTEHVSTKPAKPSVTVKLPESGE
jgi:hypothetical protein